MISCLFPRKKPSSKQDGCKLWSCENPNEAATLLRSIGLNKLASIALSCQLDGPALASVLDNLQPRLFSGDDQGLSAPSSVNSTDNEERTKNPPSMRESSSWLSQTLKQNGESAEDKANSKSNLRNEMTSADETSTLASQVAEDGSSPHEEKKSSERSTHSLNPNDPSSPPESSKQALLPTSPSRSKSKSMKTIKSDIQNCLPCQRDATGTGSGVAEVKQDYKESLQTAGAMRVKSRRSTLPMAKPHAPRSDFDCLKEPFYSSHRRFQENEKFLPIEEDDVDGSQPLPSKHDSLLKLLSENGAEQTQAPSKCINGMKGNERPNNRSRKSSGKKHAPISEKALNGGIRQISSEVHKPLRSEVDSASKQQMNQKDPKPSTSDKKQPMLNGQSQLDPNGADRAHVKTSSPIKGGNGLTKLLTMARLSESSSFHESSQNSPAQGDEHPTSPQAVNLSDLHPFFAEMDLIRKTEIASKVQVPKLWAEGSTPRSHMDCSIKINYSQLDGEQSDRSLTSQGYTSSEVCSVTS
ncbi:hypothetical protein GUITHDRAFT_103453 [Guillardia theta CCMP2712]|uniref:Uncharacterized protein n=1 Tax=Guillardia theta (strain CCMP2712) TaxID=905079 RepID=L1JS13_GUITC|nr:hypothetical protein GUITHDRAFT_103453 [Guillardia theta CCMP2712]EKX50863.1 hypothetical protein GUITHDRAFT_103453 [Guillardia theta CCMP2712]|eukprot:XP_005837843.1 hypothetical protein GUITHDRAFT_103453 [Guillardia theta CCMP2712]